MLSWKKVLDNVPESFDANPQSVKGHLRAGTHRAGMQLSGGGPALECKMFEHGTAGTNPPGPRRQCFSPQPPLLPVELCKCRPRLLLLLCLPRPQNVQESLCCRVTRTILPTIVGIARPALDCSLRYALNGSRILDLCFELLDPLHHDLDIPQVAQAPKQCPPGFLHFFP